MKIPKRLAEIQVRYSHLVTQKEKILVTGSRDVFNILMEVWNKDLIAYREEFLVLLLNRANRLKGYRWISSGGLVGTVVDAKQVFAVALKCNACSMIIAHNHPSGNTLPSDADISLTRKLKEGGELLDLRLLVSLITKSVPPVFTKSVPAVRHNLPRIKPGIICTVWIYTFQSRRFCQRVTAGARLLNNWAYTAKWSSA